MIDKRVEIIEIDGVNYERTTYVEVKEDGTEVVRGIVEAPVQTEIEPEPTEEELAQAEMLLTQSKILANQNAQDEVLAEILLNQMEV